MTEEWRDIPGYEGLYKVSNCGTVKSLDHYGSNGVSIILYKGKIVSTYKYHGYLYVHLCNGKNNKKKYLVHRLVASAFIPKISGKPQINHKDGNKSNNHVSNLEWCTQKENVIHGVETGLRKLKVPKEKYQYIYDAYLSGKTCSDIQKEFNIGKTKVYEILRECRNGTI